MLSEWVRGPKKLVITAAAGALLLSACGDRQERIDRASELASASMKQINGRKVEKTDKGSTLERADVEQRAVAGTLRNDMTVRTASAGSRYAVGSIVVKPAEVLEVSLAMVSAPEITEDEPEEMVVLEETVMLEESTADESEFESLPAPRPVPLPRPTRPDLQRPGAPKVRSLSPPPILKKLPQAERLQKTRSLVQLEQPKLQELKIQTVQKLEAKELQRLQTLDEFKSLEPEELKPIAAKRALQVANRRLAESDVAQKLKTDAETLMYQKMEKLGVSGHVEKTRAGQMVIQIGRQGPNLKQLADGTAIEEVGLPEIALSDEAICEDPATIDPGLLQTNAQLATECMIKELRASGEFEYVEKDFVFDHQFVRKPPEQTQVGPITATPNDPLWSLQWHFQDAGSGDGETLGGAGFEDFWTRQAVQGSRDVVVAVVDTGLEMAHPDIAGSPNIAPGYDFVSDPRMGNDGDGRDDDPNDPGDICNPDEPFAANSYHGTHVAGTIGAAATNNADGVAGGAWNVTIVPVRALGKCGGRLSDISDAIRWAGGLMPDLGPNDEEIWNPNPADIINLSIGLFEFCPASLQDAIDSVTERGVLVVSAAGNARVDASFYAPGGCNNVLSVAAGDARGFIAPYSNHGDVVDILAPGGDLMRDDNGDGRPDGVLSTKTASDCFDPVTGQGVANCFYAYEQGTSMAAPHVSAALALMMAKYPDKTPTEIKDLLMANLSPRDGDQCISSCSAYPGTEPLESDPTLCKRACGAGLLNLSGLGD